MCAEDQETHVWLGGGGIPEPVDLTINRCGLVRANDSNDTDRV